MLVPDTSGTSDAAGLQFEGPKVAIEIAVPTVLAEFLARSGLPVPRPRKGFALIDTGASITAVDEEVVASLGIQPIGQMKLSTPSQSRPAWLYTARLTCPAVAVLDFDILDIVGCTLQPQGFIALLGRNFLRKVVLVYDGPAGSFTLDRGVTSLGGDGADRRELAGSAAAAAAIGDFTYRTVSTRGEES